MCGGETIKNIRQATNVLASKNFKKFSKICIQQYQSYYYITKLLHIFTEMKTNIF